EDLGFAKLDSHRDLRRGFPEVILCLGKSPERIVEIARRMSESQRLALATRASREIYERLESSLAGKRVTYHGTASIVPIAVPTSVRYGASFDGMAALLGMMNSCAPGVAVVNIDNGFGAGYLATMMNR